MTPAPSSAAQHPRARKTGGGQNGATIPSGCSTGRHTHNKDIRSSRALGRPCFVFVFSLSGTKAVRTAIGPCVDCAPTCNWPIAVMLVPQGAGRREGQKKRNPGRVDRRIRKEAAKECCPLRLSAGLTWNERWWAGERTFGDFEGASCQPIHLIQSWQCAKIKHSCAWATRLRRNRRCERCTEPMPPRPLG